VWSCFEGGSSPAFRIGRVSPSIFISYAHADKPLAQALAAGLTARGVTVWIDEQELRVGDSIIERVATAVSETDFFLALVSESSRESRWCQKELHLAISGELQREGIVVLPLRVGGVEMPATLRDLLYLDVDPDDVGPAVDRLVRDVRDHVADAKEPVSQSSAAEQSSAPAETSNASVRDETATTERDFESYEPVRITGVVREGIGQPAGDGGPGSALYRVPLRLSRSPSQLWVEVFQHTWIHWPYAMLREVYIQGDRLVFPGTTMDELERSHIPHLRQVFERVNDEVKQLEHSQRVRAQKQTEERRARERAHDESTKRIAERLKFE
jgi:TIR domain